MAVLADGCGYCQDEKHNVDKEILLLERGADISGIDNNGDTVLHHTLKSERWHEERPETRTLSFHADRPRFNLSLKAPKDLLQDYITAGADIYACNDDNESPAMIAHDYGREEEWNEALEKCGIDLVQVNSHTHQNILECTYEHQKPTLSFEDNCKRREKTSRYMDQDRVEDEDEDYLLYLLVELDSECESEDELSDESTMGDSAQGCEGNGRIPI